MTSAGSGCAIVIGVGARQGIGAAIAVRAAREGLHVFVAGRTASSLERIVRGIAGDGGTATAVVCDSTRQEDLEQLFAQVGERPLRLVVYNVGRNIPAPFLQSDTTLVEGHWRRCVLGATLTGQQAVRRMLAQGEPDGHRGTILYTGASASLRGKPMFAAFAAAKAGARAMAQSMAREFGPQGIHVAHVVIDGVVDGDIVRSVGGPLGRLLIRNKGADGALLPDAVADTFWAVHAQQRSAWTHEVDLRPYAEPF